MAVRDLAKSLSGNSEIRNCGKPSVVVANTHGFPV